ncbi:oxaloacetate decarboxylase, gamma subunit [Vibrio hangzhouensis]|uniref:Oxaloacetate decarboxylase gamma chain n=2 Tax=Vibrio hangzhouensis TaxID=462991 RepID=A0A1H5Y5C5_9VIBR|nr:oxaloacetate decarboxylase, gamma subunit [Vibrio hangzhouensis]
MGLGMGFVFFFLCLMVGAIRLLTKLSSFVHPHQADTASQPQSDVQSDDNIVAAITAAIHHHNQLKANGAKI